MSPSDMPAWYLLWLDPWQLSLKYLNLATELPSDSVAQLVRAWQAICQVMGLSPSLSHFLHLTDGEKECPKDSIQDFELGVGETGW